MRDREEGAGCKKKPCQAPCPSDVKCCKEDEFCANSQQRKLCCKLGERGCGPQCCKPNEECTTIRVGAGLGARRARSAVHRARRGGRGTFCCSGKGLQDPSAWIGRETSVAAPERCPVSNGSRGLSIRAVPRAPPAAARTAARRAPSAAARRAASVARRRWPAAARPGPRSRVGARSAAQGREFRGPSAWIRRATSVAAAEKCPASARSSQRSIPAVPAGLRAAETAARTRKEIRRTAGAAATSASPESVAEAFALSLDRCRTHLELRSRSGLRSRRRDEACRPDRDAKSRCRLSCARVVGGRACADPSARGAHGRRLAPLVGDPRIRRNRRPRAARDLQRRHRSEPRPRPRARLPLLRPAALGAGELEDARPQRRARGVGGRLARRQPH